MCIDTAHVTCPVCQRVFKQGSGLSSHLRFSATCVVDVKNIETGDRILHRDRRTISFKCRILDELLLLEESGQLFPSKMLAERHSARPADVKRWTKLISTWKGQRLELLRARAEGLGDRCNILTKPRVWFPLCENHVYMEFLWQRRVEGAEIDDEWFKEEMSATLRKRKPQGWAAYANRLLSNGWLYGFKARYRISNQARTNKKKAPMSERVPRIAAFHKYWLHGVQRLPPQKCAKYGRFSASELFHMDQIPLPFVIRSSHTNNPVGEPCFINQPHGSGLDKRQATVQLCLRAEGEQLVRVAIIFRGEGSNALCAEEEDTYRQLSNLLQVYFQPNAWMDEETCCLWHDQFAEDTKSLRTGNDEFHVALGMDQHGAQMTTTMKRKMHLAGTFGVYTPTDCTDCCAPVDHHVTSRLKGMVHNFYKVEFKHNRNRWKKAPDDGGLRAWERRKYMATWVATAWSILRGDAPYIRQTFVATGFLIAKDGSENNLIQLEGVSDYDFTREY